MLNPNWLSTKVGDANLQPGERVEVEWRRFVRIMVVGPRRRHCVCEFFARDNAERLYEMLLRAVIHLPGQDEETLAWAAEAFLTKLTTCMPLRTSFYLDEKADEPMNSVCNARIAELTLYEMLLRAVIHLPGQDEEWAALTKLIKTAWL